MSVDAMCYLCLGTKGQHLPECLATPEGAVPLGFEDAWRAGVIAAKTAQGLDVSDLFKVERLPGTDPRCACGAPSLHHIHTWYQEPGDVYQCCTCYIAAGHAPADWHPDCMKAWANKQQKVKVMAGFLSAMRHTNN